MFPENVQHYIGYTHCYWLAGIEQISPALAMKVANSFESVGDVIETNLVDLGYRVLDKDIQISDTMQHLFTALGDKLSEALDATIRAVKEDDENAANEVLVMKQDIDHLINQALVLQSKALIEVGPDQIELIRMEMAALEHFKRIHTYLKRIAREIAPKATRD